MSTSMYLETSKPKLETSIHVGKLLENLYKSFDKSVMFSPLTIVNSGKFDLLMDLFFPETYVSLFEFNSKTRSLDIYRNSRLQVNSLDSLLLFEKTHEDAVFLRDTSSELYVGDTNKVSLSTLFGDISTLTVHVHDSLPSMRSAWSEAAMVSDYDQFKDNYLSNHSAKTVPADAQLHQYVVSDLKTCDAVDKFILELSKLPGYCAIENESLQTTTLQMIFPRYRNTFLKVARNARPVVYATKIDNVLSTISLLKNRLNVIEEWMGSSFVKADKRKVASLIFTAGDETHSSSKESLAIFDDSDESSGVPMYRVPVAIGGLSTDVYDSVSSNVPRMVVWVDALTPEKPVFDDHGHLMRRAN